MTGGRLQSGLARVLLLCCLLWPVSACHAAVRPTLNLDGYMDWSGAITILHNGDFVDPYFALQALLLANDNGLDIAVAAEKFSKWLLVRQKPDATFDRFCRTGPVWLGCKTADADDSLLAMWLQLVDLLPPDERRQPAWQASYDKSQIALQHLYEPARGIYLVSPVFQHGLFMDNVEVWSHVVMRGGKKRTADGDKLARAVNQVFWDAAAKRYLVSTQPEQKDVRHGFYPDHVAQVFPLLFRFPLPAGVQPAPFYRQWMKQHRAEWLSQVKTDFAWGILALLATRQGDLESASCWMRETGRFRRTPHWTVTDDVVQQILQHKKVEPAAADVACK